MTVKAVKYPAAWIFRKHSWRKKLIHKLSAYNFTCAYTSRLPVAPLLQLWCCRQACSPILICLIPQFRTLREKAVGVFLWGLFFFLKWCRHCHSISVICTWFGVFLPLLKQICWAAWWLLPFPELSKVRQPIPLYMKNFVWYPLERFSGTDLSDPSPMFELNGIWVFSEN